METFDNETLEKIKNVQSAEALLALAKENGIDMTEAEAADGFAKIKNGMAELSDDELDAVSGGSIWTWINSGSIDPGCLEKSQAKSIGLVDTNRKRRIR